jgi:CheY-like chemotaxis protein
LPEAHPLGRTVDAVSDGSQAIAATAKRWYHLVFMDLRMPGMGEREATSRIGVQRSGKHARAIRHGAEDLR